MRASASGSNRELLELLGELRVALPGVQVLFAFLLAVPFQARFADATGFQRGVYFATLTLSALASVLLIAPSALHCLNFRMADKRRVVFVSNALTIWGLLVLAVAMTGVMLLISDVLFGTAVGISVAAASAGVFAFFWWLLPTTMSGETCTFELQSTAAAAWDGASCARPMSIRAQSKSSL